MKIAERATPVAAMITALSTLACCLPFSFMGAIGFASLSVFAARYRWWLLAIALLFLVAGAVQLYRGRTSCNRPTRASVVVFWTAVCVCMLVLLFPQLLASVLAGWR
jgi:hypothetical protein